MQRIKANLKPRPDLPKKFQTTKAEKLYSKFPKSINFRQKYELQSEQARSELRQFSIENDYPTAFDAFRSMKAFHNKFKVVQW